MGRVMSATEFIAYANSQVAAIAQILPSHRQAGASCSCGRQYPCPVVQSLRQRQDHFIQRIALAEKTQQLPVVAAQPAPTGKRRLRRRTRAWWPSALVAAMRRGR